VRNDQQNTLKMSFFWYFCDNPNTTPVPCVCKRTVMLKTVHIEAESTGGEWGRGFYPGNKFHEFHPFEALDEMQFNTKEG